MIGMISVCRNAERAPAGASRVEDVTDETREFERGWRRLVEHAASVGGGRPGKRWRTEANALLEPLPPEAVRKRLVDVLDALPDDSIRGQRGLLMLAAALQADESLLAALGSAADRC